MLQDGTLLAVGPLDRETRDTYELIVMASDKGSPQREVRYRYRSDGKKQNLHGRFIKDKYSFSILFLAGQNQDRITKRIFPLHDVTPRLKPNLIFFLVSYY